jgi:hypothetical protein
MRVGWDGKNQTPTRLEANDAQALHRWWQTRPCRSQPAVLERRAIEWLRKIRSAFRSTGGIRYNPTSSNAYEVDTRVVSICGEAWQDTRQNWLQMPTREVNQLSDCRADTTYARYMRQLRPDWYATLHNRDDEAAKFKMLQSTGDGNRYFNAISILLVGNEGLHLKLRLHAAIEVITHVHKCIGGPSPSYLMAPESEVPGSRAVQGNVYVKKLLQNGSYDHDVQAAPLASWLGRNVQVFCPLNTTSTFHDGHSVHVAVDNPPVTHSLLTIAWVYSRYNGDTSEPLLTLNHFVPIACSTNGHTIKQCAGCPPSDEQNKHHKPGHGRAGTPRT